MLLTVSHTRHPPRRPAGGRPLTFGGTEMRKGGGVGVTKVLNMLCRTFQHVGLALLETGIATANFTCGELHSSSWQLAVYLAGTGCENKALSLSPFPLRRHTGNFFPRSLQRRGRRRRGRRAFSFLFPPIPSLPRKPCPKLDQGLFLLLLLFFRCLNSENKKNRRPFFLPLPFVFFSPPLLYGATFFSPPALFLVPSVPPHSLGRCMGERREEKKSAKNSAKFCSSAILQNNIIAPSKEFTLAWPS